MLVLDIPPFDFQCAVFGEFTEAEAYFRDEHEMSVDPVNCATACCVSFTCENDMRWFYMVIPPYTPIHKVAHECVHLADFSMQAAGVPTGVKNTEIRAYIVDKAMSQIIGGNCHSPSLELVRGAPSKPIRDAKKK